MTELTVGQNYTAKKVIRGASAKGDWEMIAVRDYRDKNEIAIWARNRPSGVVEGQQFNVVAIHQVKWGFRKDKSERWQPSCTCEATVKPIVSEFDTDITGQGGVNWEELKASEGDDPWADIADLPL